MVFVEAFAIVEVYPERGWSGSERTDLVDRRIVSVHLEVWRGRQMCRTRLPSVPLIS